MLNELSIIALRKRLPKICLLSPLPALERTFLGYLRTSLALSMISVIIVQLYRLEHAQNPNKVFGYFTLALPLACICIGAAIVVLLLGAYRFWRQQNAILRGKVHAGGWEMNAIGLTIALVRLPLARGSRTDRILRLCSPSSYSLSQSIQGKILWIQLDFSVGAFKSARVSSF